MSRRRRLLSLAVLGLASLATLGTGGPIPVSRDKNGNTAARGESSVLTATITIPHHLSPGTQVSISIQQPGLGGDATADALGRLTVEGGSPGPWLGLPLQGAIETSEECASPGPCQLSFEFQLRPRGSHHNIPDASLVLPWRVYVAVPINETFELVVTDPAPAPSATAVALLGVFAGFFAGLAILMAVSRLSAQRRRLALRVAPLVAALLGVVMLGEGMFLEDLPGMVLIFAAVLFAPLLIALLDRTEEPFAPGLVVGVAVVSAPVLLGLTNVQGMFRIVDVAALFAAIGVLLAIGMAVLLSGEHPNGAPEDRPRHWRAALVLGASLAALIWVWALVVAGGATEYPLWYIVIPVLTVLLLAWGAWRLWDASSGRLLVVTGILLPITAVLAFFAAASPYMFTQQQQPWAVFPSLVAIFVGGIFLAVWARGLGPRRGEVG